MIGEYEWAFYGGHYSSMAPLFEHYGIQLRTPEVGGRIGFQAEDHEETMLALGLQSKRQIARTRIRVRTAMAIQAREQRRYLGGRPPYGVPAGRRRAAPGQGPCLLGGRAHQLEPDPDTAPVVAWMFAQRLTGHSAARITRALNFAQRRRPRPPPRGVRPARVTWARATMCRRTRSDVSAPRLSAPGWVS